MKSSLREDGPLGHLRLCRRRRLETRLCRHVRLTVRLGVGRARSTAMDHGGHRTESVCTIVHTMSKRRITVTIDEALVERARSLGVNLSAACERGVAEVTETALARAELARQVAEYDDNGGVYDDKKLARARRILADAAAALAVARLAG